MPYFFDVRGIGGMQVLYVSNVSLQIKWTGFLLVRKMGSAVGISERSRLSVVTQKLLKILFRLNIFLFSN